MARIPLMALVPPVIFAAVAGLFLGGMLTKDGDDLPSAFIGKQAPNLPAEALAGTEQITDEMLRSGEITLVNFWASWCPPCRLEHPMLKELAEQGYRVAGINFRDTEEAAQSYLADEGNPFFATGFDPKGRVSIDWGVTAPPETFIVDGDGTILFRFQGPLVGADYENRFLPELRKALGN